MWGITKRNLQLNDIVSVKLELLKEIGIVFCHRIKKIGFITRRQCKESIIILSFYVNRIQEACHGKIPVAPYNIPSAMIATNQSCLH